MSSSGSDERIEGALGALRDHERAHPIGSLPEIPRYEILERLGEGSAGVVHRARDRSLGREVALKILREPLGPDGSLRDRFQREARVMAGLSHPNVLAIYEFGEADGRPFLAMELVEAGSLDKVLAGGAADPRELARLLQKTALGIEAAHRIGVVHRDLKPSNIHVTAAGEPKVGDFGLAHVIGADAGITRSGAVLGTPLYMAPEQVRGRPGEIGPWTDIYALGAILYHVLTGHPPHSAETLTELYGKIVAEDPVPPRRRNPLAPRDLETIALKAIDKEPARRYASAADVSDDLGRFLAGEPIQARRPGPGKRLLRVLGRRRVPITIVLALTLAAIAAGALGYVSIRRRSDQRIQAAEEEERKAKARSMNSLGKTREAAGDLDRAIASYTRAIEMCPDLAIAWVNRASARMKRFELDAALSDASEAIRINPASPVGYGVRGNVWMLKRNWAEAEADCRNALELAPADWPQRAQVEANLRQIVRLREK